jgi:large subunit ribosomal protein L32
MPNPKRRHSKSRQALRRTHLALKPLQLARCARCGAVTSPTASATTAGTTVRQGQREEGTEVFQKEDF